MGTVTVRVDIDIDDVIDEIDDDDLLSEIENRGLNPVKYEVKQPENLYRYLCDIAGVNYHTDKVKLLTLINEKL